MTYNVRQFRNATDHLFQLTRDFHACVGPAEKSSWVSRVNVVLDMYSGHECPRATVRDLERRAEAFRQLRGLVESELKKAS